MRFDLGETQLESVGEQVLENKERRRHDQPLASSPFVEPAPHTFEVPLDEFAWVDVRLAARREFEVVNEQAFRGGVRLLRIRTESVPTDSI